MRTFCAAIETRDVRPIPDQTCPVSTAEHARIRRTTANAVDRAWDA